MYVLAHQGGWDEILMVLAPIVVIAGLVKIVQRRAAEGAQSATRSIEAPNDDSFPTRSS